METLEQESHNISWTHRNQCIILNNCFNHLGYDSNLDNFIHDTEVNLRKYARWLANQARLRKRTDIIDELEFGELL
jgi:hypothetical protein